MSCSAHTFPLMLSSAFSNGVRETFANIVDSIEVTASPPDSASIKASGARGAIIIRAEDLIGSLRALPGPFTAGMDTEVEVVASIAVDGRGQRLLGSTVSGNGRGQGSAGFACDGGAASLTQASEQALRQTLTRLAEAFANSDRVRG
jgi:hypothetical protein